MRGGAMLDTKPEDQFRIEPGTALLILEAENLLADVPVESSALRRNSDSLKRVILWDTRKLSEQIEPCVFIAIKTTRFDSHTQAEELLNQGHIVIAQDDALQELASTQGTPKWYEEIKQHPCLIVTTSSAQARDLLLYVVSGLKQPEWTTLAITGTNGKTSTTQIASQMLEDLSQKPVLRLGTLGVQVAGISSANSYPTMPDFPGLLAAFMQADSLCDCRQVVMEATSIGLCENRMSLWQAQSAAFLNLSQDHLDYHGNMTNYFEGKLELFRKHLNPRGHVVVNCSDPQWQRVMEAAQGKSRLCIGFGTPIEKSNFFSFADAKFSDCLYLERTHTNSSVHGISGHWALWSDLHRCTGPFQYQVPLLGDVQHENLAASAALMITLGYPLQQVATATQNVRSIAGRLEPALVATVSKNVPSVLVDYAHTPDALEKTLATCRRLLPIGGRLICVFGCGGDRDPTKRPLMGEAAARLSDYVWITSDNPRTESPDAIINDIISGIDNLNRDVIHTEPDRRKAVFAAIDTACANDVVLIAGKGHEDYQIIGSKKLPFSDRSVAQDALKRLT
jgi:UDP-N-acetylmuramoyl-L-alanyl-D-glutamate--2,6-diaminopimelate ligase